MFFYSPHRAYIPNSILRAIVGSCRPTPMPSVGCWAHARPKLFGLAEMTSKASDQKTTTLASIASKRFRGPMHLTLEAFDQRLITRGTCASAQRLRTAGERFMST